MIRLAALLLICFAHQAQAAQIVETFTSRTQFDSGAAGANEAVWNQTLGKIHPSLIVANYSTVGTPIPISVNVGDGRHGAFDSTTYANFGTTSGTLLRINTATYPELNVTRFELDSPWVLEAFGPNPLVIRSQTDVIIHGTINCAGGNGGNTANASPGAGGTPLCGGKSGGAGGTDGVASVHGHLGQGESGVDVTTLVTGGTGGASIESGAGGGGGGWHSNPASPGSGSTIGGQAGESVMDAEFVTKAGGAGGGGGASLNGDGGGGGGAGGGVVLIYGVGDFELGTSGYIYANGGNGGISTATGAPGGGGGGGSVQVFMGGEIRILNSDTDGGSQAYGGTGGASNGTGGSGASGRSWFTSTSYTSAGAGYRPTEDGDVLGGDFAEFSSSKQSVITKSFDLLSSLPVLSGLTLSPSSPDFSVEYAGSDDAFASDNTGWQTTLAAVQGKRFLKLKFSIQTSNAITPAMIDSATLDYAVGIREDFEFKSAGCGRIKDGPKTPPADFALLLLFAFLFACGLKFKAHQTKRVRRK